MAYSSLLKHSAKMMDVCSDEQPVLADIYGNLEAAIRDPIKCLEALLPPAAVVASCLISWHLSSRAASFSPLSSKANS